MFFKLIANFVLLLFIEFKYLFDYNIFIKIILIFINKIKLKILIKFLS